MDHKTKLEFSNCWQTSNSKHALQNKFKTCNLLITIFFLQCPEPDFGVKCMNSLPEVFVKNPAGQGIQVEFAAKTPAVEFGPKIMHYN